MSLLCICNGLLSQWSLSHSLYQHHGVYWHTYKELHFLYHCLFWKLPPPFKPVSWSIAQAGLKLPGCLIFFPLLIDSISRNLSGLHKHRETSLGVVQSQAHGTI